jgi:RNA polymerase sigma factor (sigma-70 family)|nr:MAG TPA: RNA polymerase sigma factor [Caudoviricetes sp.]
MSTSLCSENHKVALAIFDSFSKTVMRNICRSEGAAIRKRAEKEFGKEEIKYVIEAESKEDVYPSEHFIADDCNHGCVITTEWLYNAMLLLTEQQKTLLILEFWYGLKIAEIAQVLNVSVRTIHYWKHKAFKFIREYYERGKKNEGERT